MLNDPHHKKHGFGEASGMGEVYLHGLILLAQKFKRQETVVKGHSSLEVNMQGF